MGAIGESQMGASPIPTIPGSAPVQEEEKTNLVQETSQQKL